MFVITEIKLHSSKKKDFVLTRKVTEKKMILKRLQNQDWDSVLTDKDPNSAYNEFLKIFLLHHENFFSKKKIQIKTKNLASPWITKGIVKSSKRKQKLYEKFLKRKTPQNEETYKNYKRLFETIKHKSKTNYFNDQLIKYQNNVKKTWDVIKEVIGSTKSISHTLPKRLIRGVPSIKILGGQNFSNFIDLPTDHSPTPPPPPPPSNDPLRYQKNS